MRKLRTAIVLVFMLVVAVQDSSAQNEYCRWSVETNIGPTFINNKTPYRDAFGMDNGVATYFGAEYFIPESHFSARLGYKKDELNLLGQEVQAEYSQVSVGGRWYPCKEEWFVQPYAGMNANVTVASDNGSHVQGWYCGEPYYDFEYDIKSPLVSFSPTVGFDLYVLSSLAFTMNYSYEVGLGSRYKIYDCLDTLAPLVAKGNLNHGSLNFGVKVTFPFRFTDDDGRILLISTIASLITSRRYK